MAIQDRQSNQLKCSENHNMIKTKYCKPFGQRKRAFNLLPVKRTNPRKHYAQGTLRIGRLLEHLLKGDARGGTSGHHHRQMAGLYPGTLMARRRQSTVLGRCLLSPAERVLRVASPSLKRR